MKPMQKGRGREEVRAEDGAMHAAEEPGKNCTAGR